jgi:hypothetical protein
MPRHARGRVATMAILISMAAGTAAHACTGVGVITRIDGRPQDLIITRIENGKPTVVNRPRVLEVVCQDDSVRVAGATFVTMSIDGRGVVKVGGALDYRVPPRSGAPSLAGNAYRTLDEQVLPDMKRLPWNVRIKGAGDDFGFAAPGLMQGGEKLLATRRDLLVRLVGGAAPFKVEVRRASGQTVAVQSSDTHTVIFHALGLVQGAYEIVATDSTPRELRAQIAVADSRPNLDPAYATLADPEVRAAAAASALARSAPGAWSLEAEQLLQAAPTNGLDRDKVYELIESYGDE